MSSAIWGMKWSNMYGSIFFTGIRLKNSWGLMYSFSTPPGEQNFTN